MSLLVLFSWRPCDLGGIAVTAGRWLAREKQEEVKQLAKRPAKGKRKAAKERKIEIVTQAIEQVRANPEGIEPPRVTLTDLQSTIDAFELFKNQVRHLFEEKAAKEFHAELERLKAERQRIIRQEELENELLTFLLTL
jgi:vacuolar-type H+-ATPase subunit I/STV1